MAALVSCGYPTLSSCNVSLQTGSFHKKTKHGNANRFQFLLFKKNQCKQHSMVTAVVKGTVLTESLRADIDHNSHIVSLCSRGRLKEILHYLHNMEQNNIRIFPSTYCCMLKMCMDEEALTEAKIIHEHMIRNGVPLDMFLGNNLINMYSKFGEFEIACQVFDKMPLRDLVSWTTMIVGYNQHGNHRESRRLFCQLRETGLHLDQFVFSSILKTIGSLMDLELGKQIHGLVTKFGFHSNMTVLTSLVNMYGKCKDVENARKVFDRMPERNLVSWGAMMAGYGDIGDSDEVQSLFKTMQIMGMAPHEFVFSSVLKTCANVGALKQGKQVHAYIIKMGSMLNPGGRNALVIMYGRSGSIEDARKVFDTMLERDVITWCTMIAAYARSGRCREALQMFCRMLYENIKPNKFVFATVLRGCSNLHEKEFGKQVYACIIKNDFGLDYVLGTAVVNMFVKCGCIEFALNVFDRLPDRSLTAYATMIAGYNQHGNDRESLRLFCQMLEKGMRLNRFVFSSILRTIGSLMDLELGKQIHGLVTKIGFHSDVSALTSLVNMYAKCKDVEDERKLFDRKPEQNVVSWGAMMAGYGDNEDGDD